MKHWSLAVVLGVVLVMMWVEVEGKPSNKQQLRRLGIARGRDTAEEEQQDYEESAQVESTAPQRNTGGGRGHAKHSNAKPAEKPAKTSEVDLEILQDAIMDREEVLSDREYALDIRGDELNQRSKDIDKQRLATDKSLQEREVKIAMREKALDEREVGILKLAVEREQRLGNLTQDREAASQIRELALEERERSLDEREKRVEDRELRVQKRIDAHQKRTQAARKRPQPSVEQETDITDSTTVEETVPSPDSRRRGGSRPRS